MLKAVFIDYTGTMVREDEPYTRELVRYFASHSELKDPNEILRVVWTKIKEIEAALLLGITPIYISRKVPAALDGVRVIRTLNEL